MLTTSAARLTSRSGVQLQAAAGDLEVDVILETTIPGEPVAKGRPRASIRNGHVHVRTPDKTRSWERTAALILRAAHRGEQIDRPVVLTIDVVRSRPRRLTRRKDPDERIVAATKPDADNYLKAVCDALAPKWGGGVLRDDSLVVRAVVTKWYAAKGEGACVEVRLDDWGRPG